MIKHGQSGQRGTCTRTYAAWVSMRYRCNNPTAQQYKYYGARGIKVCERWNSFVNFFEDMGERPAGTSIERLDNDKDYEPGNCKWGTPAEQSRNNRQAKLTMVDADAIRAAYAGGTKQLTIAARYGVHATLVSMIVRRKRWA